MTQQPPTDPTAQLQWLVDRAAITDLILSFARCIDDSDPVQYAANFTEDGELELPFASAKGMVEILAMPTPPPSWRMHHLMGNILFEIDGDTAKTRAYVTATHVFDVDVPTDTSQGGGWYLHEVVRTPQGWKFRKVRLHLVWMQEKELIPEDSGMIRT